MKALLALGVLIASICSATPVRASWTCWASEQLEPRATALLTMIVHEDGTSRELTFSLAWSTRFPVASQRIMWFWIPVRETELWKPDLIEFRIDTRRTDRRGSIRFVAEAGQIITERAAPLADTLRPYSRSTWVKIEDGRLIGELWVGWPWTARHFDHRGRLLGTQPLHLPGREAAQAIFTRLRAALDVAAAAPAERCDRVPDPPEEEDLLWQPSGSGSRG